MVKTSTGTKEEDSLGYKITCKACNHTMRSNEWLAQEYICTNQECKMSKRRRRSARNNQTKGTAKSMVKGKQKYPDSWEFTLTDKGYVQYRFTGDLQVEVMGKVVHNYVPPQAVGVYAPRIHND